MSEDFPLPFEFEPWWQEWGEYVLDLSDMDESDAERCARDEWRLLRRQFDRDGGVEAYRTMKLDDATAEAFADASGPVSAGRYWTRDRLVAKEWTAATEYDGREVPESGAKRMIKAFIPIEVVDAAGTVAARLGSSYEDEIRLRPGAEVRVLDIENLEPSAPKP